MVGKRKPPELMFRWNSNFK